MPFQKGNKLGGRRKNSLSFQDVIVRCIKQDDADRLRKAGEALLSMAANGELPAIKELFDRLDGKAAQSVVIEGGDEPVRIQLTASEALTSKIRGLVAVPGVVQGLGESGEGAERGEGAGEV